MMHKVLYQEIKVIISNLSVYIKYSLKFSSRKNNTFSVSFLNSFFFLFSRHVFSERDMNNLLQRNKINYIFFFRFSKL